MGYELLDNDLTDSTLWLFGSKDAKILFVTILSKCHGSEVVRTPIPVLVKLAGLTREEGEAAMEELEAPDENSKYPGDGGRRVVRFEDDKGRGVRLPSYKERRNRYLASDRKKSERERQEADVTVRHDASRSVTPRHGKFALETEQSRAETEQDTGQFDAFWSLYPRRVGRLPALRAWALLSEKDRLSALDGVRRLAEVWRGRPRTELRFCPHGASWLNQRRWEDEPEPVVAAPRIASAADMAEMGARALAEAAESRRK